MTWTQAVPGSFGSYKNKKAPGQSRDLHQRPETTLVTREWEGLSNWKGDVTVSSANSYRADDAKRGHEENTEARSRSGEEFTEGKEADPVSPQRFPTENDADSGRLEGFFPRGGS